mgnify:CR=1 FL=1
MNKNKLVIFANSKIIDVLKIYNKTGYKSVLVIDKNNRLIGSLSEGDIRRSLLKDSTLKSRIDKIYNKNPFYLKKTTNKKKLKHYFQKFDFDLIPIINENHKITKIIPWKFSIKEKSPDFSKKKLLPVIMAGGKGLRMKPFTNILPKPLIPIRGKAIIDHILEKFITNKFKKIFISISQNSSILETFLKKYKKNTNLSFIKENKPLGTIGSLKKIRLNNCDDVLITNCDILLNIDFGELYKFHKNYDNDMTIVVSRYTVKVPYGVCEFNKEGQLNSLTEKPKKNYFIMCGMYIMNKKIIKFIPKNKFTNIDDLIIKLKKQKYKIGVYPIKQIFFNDVGEWDKYLKTLKNKIL